MRVTLVLVNYRRLPSRGQRLRCKGVNGALSNRNSCRRLQHPLNENMQGRRQWVTLTLGYRWLFAEQPRGQLHPRWPVRFKSPRRATQNQGVRPVQGSARRILKVFFCRINYREIETGPQELQQRIAFDDKRSRFFLFIPERFLQRRPQQRKSFRQKSLLCAQPEGALRPRRQKSRAVRPRVRLCLPTDRADVLIRRTVAIRPVLRAPPVPILRKFSRDPLCLGKSGNHVAHQLRFPNAAGVPPNYDHPPA